MPTNLNARRVRVATRGAIRSVIQRLESRVLLSATHGPIRLNPHLLNDIRKSDEADFDPVPSRGGATEPYAPPLGGTIEAVNFDSQASSSGFFEIPPDNTAAAGPNHVVNAVNTAIQFFTKAGTLQLTQRLGKNGTNATGSFFAAQNPVNTLFDPRVIYDQYNGRFVVLAAEKTATTSRILVAVSDDSDPNGTWFTTAINSTLNIAGVNCWADFPTLAVDSQAIYITGNMFPLAGGGGVGSRLWILNKTPFYSNGAASVNVFDAGAATGLGALPTVQPAQMFGAAPGSTGTFLVTAGFFSGATDFLSVIRLDNPLTAPTFSNQFVSLGDVDNTNVGFGTVPQLGSATGLDPGDGRVGNAVWRNNALWVANSVVATSGVDAGTVTAHWVKIDTSTLSTPVLADQGYAGGEDIAANTRTFFPSIMVDASGNMGLSFAASGPNIFAGAYYTGRLAGDPAGTVQPTVTLAQGTDFYLRTFGGGRNRWGDYSSISLDPSDNATFWVYNQYATTRGTAINGEDGRWATRYGKFAFAGAGSAIAGQAFWDFNANNTLDAGETPLNGATVFIDLNNNGLPDAGEPSTTTAGSGNYSFAGLANGTYNLREVAPSGFVVTSSNQVIVTAAGQSFTGVNFSNVATVYTGTAGADNYLLRKNVAATKMEILVGGVLTYTLFVGQVPSLTFNLLGGDDTLTLDYVNGAPIPSSGVSYDGGTHTGGDTLSVNGSIGNDTFTVNAASIFGGGTTTFTNVEFLTINGNDGGDTVNQNAAPAATLTFNGGLGLAFQDTLNVNAGSYTFNADASAGSAALNVNVAAGASVLFNATQHLNALSLAGVATLSAVGNGLTIVTKSFSVTAPGGSLNLSNGYMVVDWTGSSPLASVRSALGAGYAGGAWNGTAGSIRSSTAAATTGRGLGYAEASDIFSSFPAGFGGQSVDNTSVLVAYTLYGDTNLSRSVDLTDFTFLAANFNKSSGALWNQGDFNYDGKVDLTDFTFLAGNFNQAIPAAPASLPLTTAGTTATAPVVASLGSVQRPYSTLPIRIDDGTSLMSETELALSL